MALREEYQSAAAFDKALLSSLSGRWGITVLGSGMPNRKDGTID
jgi:hypothetical protein